LFIGIKDEIQRHDFLARMVSPEIEIVFFKSYPNYPFFNYLCRSSIKNALLKQNINLNEVLFHTRGEMIACHLSKVLGNEYYKNIIPDVRGASLEEIIEITNFNIYSNSSLKNKNCYE